MKSRIAIFEGYGAPRAYSGRGYGGPIFSNPQSRPGRPLGGPLGRRAYYVPPAGYRSEDSRGGYGPGRKPRKGYKVRRIKDTPAMKRAQSRMKKAAKKCKRTRKGTYRSCMRRELRKK